MSDCTQHEPAPAIWNLLDLVIKRLFEIKTLTKCIHFQSDGLTALYKNKKNFYLFHSLCKKNKLEKATFNFTPAGHGKDAADGFEGTAKRMCDTAVANG